MVDVLIITALREELDALLSVCDGRKSGWQLIEGDPPHHEAVFEGRYGDLTIAAARSTGMTARNAAPLAERLVERLAPRALAMCGVCAGNPDETALGDVVIADRVYQYDDGKRTADGWSGDQAVYALRPQWLHAAQDMVGAARDLEVYAEPSDGWPAVALLDHVQAGYGDGWLAGIDRHFPEPSARRHALERLCADDLLAFDDGRLHLTPNGQAQLDRHRVFEAGPITNAPLHIHVGAMASGNAVREDPDIWRDLKAAQRKTLAVEMEAAGLATVAHGRELRFVVAKGVMDHADSTKSDRFKGLAARASAEVLLRLLRRVAVRPTALAPSGLSMADMPKLVPQRLDAPDFANIEALTAGIEALRAQVDEQRLLEAAHADHPSLEFRLTKTASGKELLVRAREGRADVRIDLGELAFPETEAGEQGKAKYRALVEHGTDAELRPGEYRWTRTDGLGIFDYVLRDHDPASMGLTLRSQVSGRELSVWLRIEPPDQPPFRLSTRRRLIRQGTETRTYELAGGQLAGRIVLTVDRTAGEHAQSHMRFRGELDGASLDAARHTLRVQRALFHEQASFRVISIETDRDLMKGNMPSDVELDVSVDSIDGTLRFVDALGTVARLLRLPLVYRYPSPRDVHTAIVLAHALEIGPTGDPNWGMTLGVPDGTPLDTVPLAVTEGMDPNSLASFTRLLDGPVEQLSVSGHLEGSTGYILFGEAIDPGPSTILLGNARLKSPAEEVRRNLAAGVAFSAEVEFDTWAHAFFDRYGESAPEAGDRQPIEAPVGRPATKKKAANRRREKQARKARRKQRRKR